MSAIPVVLLHAAVLAYAFVGGVFLAFSDFIMRALAQTQGTGGVDTMQVVNREVFRWVFMALFISLAPLSLAIAAYGGIFVEGAPGALLIAAGLVYLLGCFGVTVGRNVPLNETLAAMEISDPAILDYWTGTYLPRWTYWNTVRTLACGLAAALLLLGLRGL